MISRQNIKLNMKKKNFLLLNSIKKLLYFSCQICKSLFLSLLNSHQILADSHFSLEGFFFYFSFFGKISCCVLLPVSPSWEVLHKTWWLLNWARDCAAYLKKEDNFSFSLYTLAKINLLCMKNVGTQWTMVSYLKKNIYIYIQGVQTRSAPNKTLIRPSKMHF